MKIEDAAIKKDQVGSVYTVTAWAEDFTYALEERPWICKLLFRIAIGRYAWREFTGMVIAMIQDGWFIPKNVGYGLRGMDYHKEKIEWWGLK